MPMPCRPLPRNSRAACRTIRSCVSALRSEWWLTVEVGKSYDAHHTTVSPKVKFAAGRIRGHVSSISESAADGGLTQTRKSPEDPVRFNWASGSRFTTTERGQGVWRVTGSTHEVDNVDVQDPESGLDLPHRTPNLHGVRPIQAQYLTMTLVGEALLSVVLLLFSSMTGFSDLVPRQVSEHVLQIIMLASVQHTSIRCLTIMRDAGVSIIFLVIVGGLAARPPPTGDRTVSASTVSLGHVRLHRRPWIHD